MMRQFIVHFGAHKTGTTAFQRFLQDNRDILTAAGLCIPRLPEGQDGNYQGLARVMAGEYNQYPNRVRRFMRSLDPIVRPSFKDDVLISSEHLSSGKFRPYLSTFANSIDALGFKKIAILVIRDQISWFNSRISQKRKMLLETPLPFQEHVTEMISEGEGDWDDLCRKLQTLGFKVVVIANNERFNKKGVVRSLFETPPIKAYASKIKLAEPMIYNTSFGAKQQILADLIRDYISITLNLPTHKVDRHALRNIMVDCFAEQMTDSPYNGFTPAFRKHVLAHFKASNARLAKTYFPEVGADMFPQKHMPEISPQLISDLPSAQQVLLRNIAEKVINHANRQGLFDGK